jgi:hypothetical protein
MASDAPAAVLLVRVFVAAVFVSEGIQKSGRQKHYSATTIAPMREAISRLRLAIDPPKREPPKHEPPTNNGPTDTTRSERQSARFGGPFYDVSCDEMDSQTS